MSELQKMEAFPGVMIQTRAYINDFEELGETLAKAEDYELVAFLKGFLAEMKSRPWQWTAIREAADNREIDLKDLGRLMNEFFNTDGE